MITLRFPAHAGMSLFSTASRQGLRPTQSPIQPVTVAPTRGEVKLVEGENYQSPPSSAEVMNAWSYTSTPCWIYTGHYNMESQDTRECAILSRD
jgi:hypothetical protein